LITDVYKPCLLPYAFIRTGHHGPVEEKSRPAS
jgi:hypothetical protein